MEKRHEELSELKLFTQRIDKDITMILQSLQWDRSKLMETPVKVTCRYDTNHKIPPDRKANHEVACSLVCQGYRKDDILLPDPIDLNSNTLVNLTKDSITKIINAAKLNDPLFKTGPGGHTVEPCTVERLQGTYSADERRAIHDAVVAAAPFCHNLTDLALASTSGDDPHATSEKSRGEILAELRDMKRRRAKYRVAAKSRNYSDVLRDVIRTQMELYTDVKTEVIKTEPIETENDSRHEAKYAKESPAREARDKNRGDWQKHRSRHSQDDNKSTTFKEKRDHNKHKELDKRDASREKYHSHNISTSREHNDHYRSRNKEDRDSDRRKDDRKYNYERDRHNKYQDKPSSSKESRERKKEYRTYDTRDVKEEKYKRYYDVKDTSYDNKSKRTKYS